MVTISSIIDNEMPYNRTSLCDARHTIVSNKRLERSRIGAKSPFRAAPGDILSIENVL